MQKKAENVKRLFAWLRLLQHLKISEGQTLLIWAVLCGLFGALAALGFKMATSGLLYLFTGEHGGFVSAFSAIPQWQRLLVPTVGALICGVILQLSKPITQGSKTDYMEAVALGDGVVHFRSSMLRSIAAMFAIAGGESIGREGPLVQISALASSLWGRLRGLPPARLRIMVACGAASGLAAAYHSPLGGAFFVAEVVIGSIAMETLGPLLIASTISTLVVQSLEGFTPLYSFPHFSDSNAGDIACYAVAGGIMGLASIGWMKILGLSKPTFALLRLPLWLRLTLGGLLIGLMAMKHPEVCGNGRSLIQSILADKYLTSAIALFVCLKVLATCISFGSGAIGGVFTPSLLVGAGLGYMFAAGLQAFNIDVIPNEMALICMGAFLAAAANAPATSILMIFEMSMQYNVVLPLMVSTVIAYATARSLSSNSLYSKSLLQGTRGVLDKPIREIRVEHIMRKDAYSIRPLASFREVGKAFLKEARQEIWVTSEAGFLGCILLSEVGPFLKDVGNAETVLAADIVSEDVPVLSGETPLTEAFQQFSRSSLNRLPVVTHEGLLIGELSRPDVFITISELAKKG